MIIIIMKGQVRVTEESIVDSYRPPRIWPWIFMKTEVMLRDARKI